MIRAENAYYPVFQSPVIHRYTYTDAETVIQGRLVSPVSDRTMRTLLTTGCNGTLRSEFADSAAVYQTVTWEDTNGNTNTLTSEPIPSRPGYYRIVWNGVVMTSSQSSRPYEFCLRTDYITLTADGYVAGGRIFYRGYYSPTQTFTDSWTLSNCKLEAQTWEQTEKMHHIEQSE